MTIPAAILALVAFLKLSGAPWWLALAPLWLTVLAIALVAGGLYLLALAICSMEVRQ